MHCEIIASTNQIQVASAWDDLAALAAAVRHHHAAAAHAARDFLDHALDAGDALKAAKDKVGHGNWLKFLKRECDVSERTANSYMRLAANRAVFAANPQRAANLSLRTALSMVAKKGAGTRHDGDGAASTHNPPIALSSLAWSDATLDERRHFLDAIGLQSLLEALPQTFRDQLTARILAQYERAQAAAATATQIARRDSDGSA